MNINPSPPLGAVSARERWCLLVTCHMWHVLGCNVACWKLFRSPKSTIRRLGWYRATTIDKVSILFPFRWHCAIHYSVPPQRDDTPETHFLRPKFFLPCARSVHSKSPKLPSAFFYANHLLPTTQVAAYSVALLFGIKFNGKFALHLKSFVVLHAAHFRLMEH